MSTQVDLHGGRRGVLVDWQQRREVWEWAQQQKITICYWGSLAEYDIWYVRNNKDRAWFMLRWL